MFRSDFDNLKPGSFMTAEEFKNLKPGDVICRQAVNIDTPVWQVILAVHSDSIIDGGRYLDTIIVYSEGIDDKYWPIGSRHTVFQMYADVYHLSE